jgi:hypothetical protein
MSSDSEPIPRHTRNRLSIGSKVITADDMRMQIAHHSYKIIINSIDDIPDTPALNDILNYLYSEPEKLWTTVPYKMHHLIKHFPPKQFWISLKIW